MTAKTENLRRVRTCGVRTSTRLDSPPCGAPAVGKRWGTVWACRDHIEYGES